MVDLIVALGTGLLAALQISFYITPKNRLAPALLALLAAGFTLVYLRSTENWARIAVAALAFSTIIPLSILGFKEKIYCKVYNIVVHSVLNTLCLYLAGYLVNVFIRDRAFLPPEKLIPVLFLTLATVWCVVMGFMRKHKFTVMPFSEDQYRRSLALLGLSYPPLLAFTWGYLDGAVLALREHLPIVIIGAYILMVVLILNSFLNSKIEHLNKNTRAIVAIQSTLLKRYMEGLKQNQERLRLLGHDQKHHLATARSLLESGRTDRAISLLEDMDRDIKRYTGPSFCGDAVINAILLNGQSRAEELNIRFRAEVRLEEPPALEDVDLSALMLNAIDNAVEGCARLPEGFEGFIRLSLYTAGGFFVLKIENPIHENVNIVNNRIATSKGIDENPHGIGLESIETIVRRHNGKMVLEAGNGLIKLQTVMENSPGPPPDKA